MALFIRYVDGVRQVVDEDGNEVLNEIKPEPLAPSNFVEGVVEVEEISVELPPIIDRANSFASDMTAWVKARFQMSDDQDNRWQICQSCDYLSEKGQCLHCGCWMRWKIKMGTAHCKLGKW